MPVRGVFNYFFYLHADERGNTRSSIRWQTSFCPWPKGKSNCLPTCPHHLTLILNLGGSRTGEAQLRLVQLDDDRSAIHPKLKSKLDMECRKTLGSTARPRRETLFGHCF